MKTQTKIEVGSTAHYHFLDSITAFTVESNHTLIMSTQPECSGACVVDVSDYWEATQNYLLNPAENEDETYYAISFDPETQKNCDHWVELRKDCWGK